MINKIKSKKVEYVGYVYNGTLSTKHCFQFEDDTAIVTALERDKQLLCNAFLKCSTWADLIIRVNKYHTFGMKKSNAKSIQFQLLITLKKEQIPSVKLEESFTYLGKDFNFNMNCDEVKNELKSEVLKYILSIDKLPLKCRTKIDIVQRYVFSKIRWSFSIYNISETWVTENIDNEINKYYRKWLQIPISSNLPTLVYQRKCLVSTLKQINKYKYSVNSLFVEFSKRYEMKKLELCIILPAVKMLNLILTLNLLGYQNVTSKLPDNIIKFSRRYFIYSLSNGTNLQKWKQKDSPNCLLCNQKETSSIQ